MGTCPKQRFCSSQRWVLHSSTVVLAAVLVVSWATSNVTTAEQVDVVVAADFKAEFVADKPNAAKGPSAKRKDAKFRTKSGGVASPAASRYRAQLEQKIESLLKAGHKRIGKWPLFTAMTAEDRRKLLCEFKKHPPFTLAPNLPPFNVPDVKRLFPSSKQTAKDLFRLYPTCALVSSAGSILGSGLGEQIDSFEQVVRFNSAPIKGFEADVGHKTTWRFVYFGIPSSLPLGQSKMKSSHVVDFPDSANATFVGWDICHSAPTRLPLHKCYSYTGPPGLLKKAKGRGGNAVPNWLRWRAKNPNRKFHMLDIKWLNALTDIFQRHSPYRLYPTLMPSTGFIGFAFMLHVCKRVHVYHMIPPLKKAGRCKYFTAKVGRAEPDKCSLYDGHQRHMEVAMMMKLNEASDDEAYVKGHAVVPGLVDLKCGNGEEQSAAHV